MNVEASFSQIIANRRISPIESTLSVSVFQFCHKPSMENNHGSTNLLIYHESNLIRTVTCEKPVEKVSNWGCLYLT